MVDIQAQALTEYPTYQPFVRQAKPQALQANPYCRVLAGVSTHYGKAEQMAAAAKSVKVNEYWLNVPGPDPNVAKLASSCGSGLGDLRRSAPHM
jgi:hypothetical protein